MELPSYLSNITTLLIALVLFSCGLLVNTLQLGLLLFVFPVSRNVYRLLNYTLCELLWGTLIFLVDWWSNTEVKVYGDDASIKALGTEHGILISNHRSDVDWLVGLVLAQRTGCLGGAKAVAKLTLSYLPIIGWSMWFSEYVFLHRNWAKDQRRLKSTLAALRGFPRPMWIATFPEGTRFTPEKHAAARDFAASAGRPLPTHTLVPRTRGLVAIIDNTREFVPAIYDMTLAVPSASAQPTVTGIFNRKPCTVHLHVRRVPISDLPTEEDKLTEWIHATWQAKDAFLAKHAAAGTFGEDIRKPVTRTLSSLMIGLFWLVSFVVSAVYLTVWGVRSGALTWRALPYAGVPLLVIVVLLHIMVNFSRSDKSTPASKLARPKKMNGDGDGNVNAKPEEKVQSS